MRRITLDLFAAPGGWSHAPTLTWQDSPGSAAPRAPDLRHHADERP
ncbi:hypothetical protein [Streptomyces canus]|nr:hypothetical protein [Streptomyces canus]